MPRLRGTLSKTTSTLSIKAAMDFPPQTNRHQKSNRWLTRVRVNVQKWLCWARYFNLLGRKPWHILAPISEKHFDHEGPSAAESRPKLKETLRHEGREHEGRN